MAAKNAGLSVTSSKKNRRDDLVESLLVINATTSGSIEELEARLSTYQKAPGVYEAIKENVRQRKKNQGIWKRARRSNPRQYGAVAAYDPFPSFTQEQLRCYVQPKLPGGFSRLQRGLKLN